MTRTQSAMRMILFLLGVFCCSRNSLHAQQAKVRELRVQRVGGDIYFHVRLEKPKDLRPITLNRPAFWSEENANRLQQLPRLIPQDGNTEAVHWQLKYFPDPEEQKKHPEEREKHVDGLEFVGKWQKPGKAKFLFLYPFWKNKPDDDEEAEQAPWKWKQISVELNFHSAQKVFPPSRPGPRTADLPIQRDEVEALWAFGHAAYFSFQEWNSRGYGFFGFARAAVSRIYGVPTSGFGTPRIPPTMLDRQLYDISTGSAAVTEALQLQRMLNPPDSQVKPTIDIAGVSGINLPNIDWKVLLKGKNPSVDPLARLTPHDHYYVQFRDFGKFTEFLDLVEKWGAPLLWALEPHHRDYQLRRRYEEQLCLPSKALAKRIKAEALTAVSLSGSDLYLRDGSDLTVIFGTTNRPAVLAALGPSLQQARKKHGASLRESKSEYQTVSIESFVTPLREVSLHRAVIGDFIVYSNSMVALRRVVDTHQGWRKSLAQSPDFQYIRTVFSDEKGEDGFVFFSDAFFRQMAGPANRIKAKRRLEALTNLSMVTHAALFTAWETGKLPAGHEHLLSSAGLSDEDIASGDDRSTHWDGERKLAVSDVYNTLRFSTPLIELSIDKITQNEQQAYTNFRYSYQQQWRGYLDPIGIRINVRDEEVKIDTHLLPLVQNFEYTWLRRLTGNGVAHLDPTSFSSKTLVQFLTHVSPTAAEREQLNVGLKLLGVLGQGSVDTWLGEWMLIRFDDSPAYKDILDRWRRTGLPFDLSGDWDSSRQSARRVFQMPITIGIHIKNPIAFTGFLAEAKRALNDYLPGSIKWETQQPAYKGVNLVRIQAAPDGALEKWINEKVDEKDRIIPKLYYTLLGDGWFVSTSEASLNDVIDHWVKRKNAKNNQEKKLIPVHGSLYVAPGAADKAKDFLRSYFAWDIHRRTLANIPLWDILYRSDLVTDRMTSKVRRETALHYFGFIPASPDATLYTFQDKTDEVINHRHGSLREPQKHAAIAEDSPLAQLLEEIEFLRADILFPEEGLETTLTLRRNADAK